MPFWLVKVSASPVSRLAVIATVAPVSCVSSGSLSVSDGSTAASEPSVTVTVPPELAICGASLAGVIVTVRVAGVLTSSPSSAVSVTVRLAAGSSLVVENVTVRSAAWYWASVAEAPVGTSVSVPVAAS